MAPDPEARLRIAYWLLVPAPLIFAGRAAAQLAGTDLPGFLFAIAGILSGLGMVVAIWAMWKGPDQWRTVAAVAVALLGHYVVSRFVDADLGGAMVYLGTGFVAGLRVRWGQYAGMLAGAGALLRGETNIWFSHSLLIVGAVAIAAALVVGARGPQSKA